VYNGLVEGNRRSRKLTRRTSLRKTILSQTAVVAMEMKEIEARFNLTVKLTGITNGLVWEEEKREEQRLLGS
jgi:hypothetical protein